MGASATGIAQSGLEVASLTLDVSAHNVANTLTEGFRPGRVEPAELEAGGVTATVTRPPDPLAEVRADRALLVPSNVDLARELTSQTRAAAVYRANLAALETAQQLERDTVEALGPR